MIFHMLVQNVSLLMWLDIHEQCLLNSFEQIAGLRSKSADN